jgi:hypothetical protein
MRSTRPEPPLSSRSANDVMEVLCVALRNLGISTRFLPHWGPVPDVEVEVAEVKRFSAELATRNFDHVPRLKVLTEETGWQMVPLLEEALSYPAMRPWVRDAKDGVRIALRCGGCSSNEFPESSQKIRLCDACLDHFQRALEKPTESSSMLLYRSFTPEARCEHATSDTVLGVYPWSQEWCEDFPVGVCPKCLDAERSRRRAA